ncbi:hypothetical protein BDM02DRAFT_3131798 [Thelephora ganbajun]|uniref:Uncharacterized protein n=1 Tax=Thelephora ganbajun TaxID=370292 RepID=A0ACB6Z3Q4_THEGA|nr:hypothetical protein BDM02DRAFT_3131798 [Thelephora ganbajun]
MAWKSLFSGLRVDRWDSATESLILSPSQSAPEEGSAISVRTCVYIERVGEETQVWRGKIQIGMVTMLKFFECCRSARPFLVKGESPVSLKICSKVSHGGFATWLRCLNSRLDGIQNKVEYHILIGLGRTCDYLDLESVGTHCEVNVLHRAIVVGEWCGRMWTTPRIGFGGVSGASNRERQRPLREGQRGTPNCGEGHGEAPGWLEGYLIASSAYVTV